LGLGMAGRAGAAATPAAGRSSASDFWRAGVSTAGRAGCRSATDDLLLGVFGTGAAAAAVAVAGTGSRDLSSLRDDNEEPERAGGVGMEDLRLDLLVVGRTEDVVEARRRFWFVVGLLSERDGVDFCGRDGVGLFG